MNLFPLLTNERVEGELAGWARRRLRKRVRSKAKVQKCHQIWIAVGLISHCIILSSESHLSELENTHANTMYSKRFRKSSQWLGYGQSLAVSWKHSVPTFLCHWGLISPIWQLGCNHPFLTPCLWHFLIISSSVFSSSSSLFSAPVSPHRCRELSVLQRGPQHNQRMWGNLPLQGEHQFFSLPTEHPVCSPQDS